MILRPQARAILSEMGDLPKLEIGETIRRRMPGAVLHSAPVTTSPEPLPQEPAYDTAVSLERVSASRSASESAVAGSGTIEE